MSAGNAGDRVLGALGYAGDLDAAMPRQEREVLFGQGELTRAILAELQCADWQMGSREIAQGTVAVSGSAARDLNFSAELTRGVSKALHTLKGKDVVRSSVDANGNLPWSLRALGRL